MPVDSVETVAQLLQLSGGLGVGAVFVVLVAVLVRALTRDQGTEQEQGHGWKALVETQREEFATAIAIRDKDNQHLRERCTELTLELSHMERWRRRCTCDASLLGEAPQEDGNAD